jgi:hypothetical protein
MSQYHIKAMAWNLWYLPVAVLLWIVIVVTYRLYLHPLSHIPGPRAAAATDLYKTYFNATGGSKFYLQIEKLHQKFGKCHATSKLRNLATDRI